MRIFNPSRCLLRSLATLAAVLLFVVLWSRPASGHTLPISYLYVVPDTDYLHLELMLNPFELSFFSELDTNHDGQLQPAELETVQSVVAQRILSCLKVTAAGKILQAETFGVTPDLDSHHLTLRAHYPADARRSAVSIASTLADLTSGSHVTQVTWLHAGRRQFAQLEMRSNQVTFESPDKPPASAANAAWLRVRLSLISTLLLILSLGEAAVFGLILWRMPKIFSPPTPP